MAFPWPGKKESQPGAKPEFPSAFDLGSSGDADLKDDAPTKVSIPAAIRDDAPAKAVFPSAAPVADDELLVLTQRLEQLGGLLDQAKDQVTSYLIHRESLQGGDSAKTMARKIEAMFEQLSGGGGRMVDQKLDAIYGRLDQLASAAPRTGAAASSGDGGAPAVSEAAVKTAVRPVVEKLEQMDARFKTLDALKEAFVPNLVKVRDALSEQHGALNTGLRQLSEIVPQYFNALPQYFNAIQQQVAAAQQHVDAGLRTIVDILRPPETDSSAGVSGDWQQAILGPELCGNPGLSKPRQELLCEVLAGEPAACGLAGTLMIFRSAPAEKMAPLLKEIGEAYYRWRPRAGGKVADMEQALAAWLQRACEQSGMSNSIELVHPGERFDSTRHNSPRPGVEITQVLGWIVLRDNGKVYTKASVAVK
jgi:hypothetical protein